MAVWELLLVIRRELDFVPKLSNILLSVDWFQIEYHFPTSQSPEFFLHEITTRTLNDSFINLDLSQQHNQIEEEIVSAVESSMRILSKVEENENHFETFTDFHKTRLSSSNTSKSARVALKNIQMNY